MSTRRVGPTSLHPVTKPTKAIPPGVVQTVLSHNFDFTENRGAEDHGSVNDSGDFVVQMGRSTHGRCSDPTKMWEKINIENRSNGRTLCSIEFLSIATIHVRVCICVRVCVCARTWGESLCSFECIRWLLMFFLCFHERRLCQMAVF